jgi:hypothetical protein
MEQRVSLITLGVADVGRARAFYEALGWRGQSPDGEVVFFQAGGMVVALWSREKLAADSGVADGGGWGGITLAHNVRTEGEVNAILQEAREAGGTVLREASRAFWGGHPWEVAMNPGWTLTDDGSVRLEIAATLRSA